MKTLEANARRAQEATSFREYRHGKATSEYREYCREAEAVAEEAITRLKKGNAPKERIERVEYLLSKYKIKKLEWLNSLYASRAAVPSVMIAGPANYPVRKLEKQVARERKLYENDPDYILEQIRGAGSTAHVIRSDEADAVERIKQKIARLEAAPPDQWGYNKAEIRRLRGRLLILAPEEFKEEGEQTTVNGVKTFGEIAALWESGQRTTSVWDDKTKYFFALPLVFYNGKRNYKEYLSIETDEGGENLLRYDVFTHTHKVIPLTKELKYNLIVSRIQGSGNKAIMYKHLLSLAPSAQEAEEVRNESVKINGEAVEVVRNKDITRLQLIFDGKPEVETRNKIKSAGFRWAPTQMAWQRLLNGNAEAALKRIVDK